jgi:hypothetical protein
MLTTQVSMLASPRRLPTLPTKPSSSRDSSTTSDGLSLHSTSSWELSALQDSTPGPHGSERPQAASSSQEPELSLAPNQEPRVSLPLEGLTHLKARPAYSVLGPGWAAEKPGCTGLLQ